MFEKSNCIIIGSKDKTVNRNIKLKINGNIIKQIIEVKLLVLYIDYISPGKVSVTFFRKKYPRHLDFLKD